MKYKQWLLGVFGVALIFILSACSLSEQKHTYMFDDLISGIEITEKIETLKIHTDITKIEVHPSPDATVNVQFVTDAPEDVKKNMGLRWKSGNKSLEIGITANKKLNTNLLSQFEAWRSKLIVYVPEKQLQTLELENAVSGIEVSGLTVSNVKFKNDVGKVNATDLVTQSTMVDVSVGAVHLERIEGELKVTNQMGSIYTLFEAITSDVEMHNSVGAITVDIMNEPQHLAVDLSTEIGRIETNLQQIDGTVENRRVKGTIGKGNPQLKSKTEIGKIMISVQD